MNRHMVTIMVLSMPALSLLSSCKGRPKVAEEGKRSNEDTQAAKTTTAPATEFVVQSHWAHSRLVLSVIGKDSGLWVVWALPPEITERLQENIRPGERSPLVRLFQGVDMASYLAPSGSPRRPREHEDAVAGTLVCKPMGGKTVSISLQGVRFPSRQIDHVGPLEVQLDEPPPP